jgi:hypothetical protein
MFATTDLPVFVTKSNKTMNHKTVFVFKKNLRKKGFCAQSNSRFTVCKECKQQQQQQQTK